MINDLEDLKVDTCQVDADGKTLGTFNVPDADGQVVAGSCREDLDEELVSRYIAAVRETTPRLVNENDTDVLTTLASSQTVRAQSLRWLAYMR